MNTDPMEINWRVAARELLDWQKTGILCNGEVRRLASSMTDLPDEQRLVVAEMQVKKRALIELSKDEPVAIVKKESSNECKYQEKPEGFFDRFFGGDDRGL